jgi:hypothetical protein
MITAWTPPPDMLPEVATGWKVFYAGIRRTYGITPAEYRALYLAQLGRCYICQKARGKHPDDPKGKGSQRLGVDHNHAFGNRREAVRGLLCSKGPASCNRIIGWLDHRSLVRAVQYVEEMPAQGVLALLRDADTITDEALTGQGGLAYR